MEKLFLENTFDTYSYEIFYNIRTVQGKLFKNDVISERIFITLII